jgi:hypothetical protein
MMKLMAKVHNSANGSRCCDNDRFVSDDADAGARHMLMVILMSMLNSCH